MTQAEPGSDLKGVGYGIVAVLMWAAHMSFARAGSQTGLMPQDFVLLRYIVAGLVMLPWVLWAGCKDLGGVGWGRGAVLTLFAGPLFVMFGTGGFQYAPLSHGAVIQPSTAALVTMVLGWLVLREKVTLLQAFGTFLLLSGLLIVASRSLAGTQAHPDALWGDMMFFVGGLLWVGFTFYLRKWAVGGVAATAAVSVLSLAVTLPLFFILSDGSRIAVLAGPTLLTQLVVQGLGAGILALIAYGKAVEHLGAARAGLFPAMVPVCTLMMGVPVTGEIPSLPEASGAVLATIGLAIAMGVLQPLLNRRQARTPAA